MRLTIKEKCKVKELLEYEIQHWADEVKRSEDSLKFVSDAKEKKKRQTTLLNYLKRL